MRALIARNSMVITWNMFSVTKIGALVSVEAPTDFRVLEDGPLGAPSP